MNILYIDTTGKMLSAILIKDGIKHIKSDDSGYHSIRLLPVIDTLLTENNIPLREIDIFCVNKGPGRFTGTRIGIITALILAEVNNKKLVYLTNEDNIKDIEEIVNEREGSIQAKAIYDSKSYFEE